MGLRLTLKPNERIVVNGCVIRNSDRRQVLTVENRADVVRESDLLDKNGASTPAKEVYFLAQSALIEPALRDKLIPVIQKKLAGLVPVFHDEISGHIFEAANHVSARDFYKALRSLRPVIDYEAQLYDMIAEKQGTAAAG